MGNKSDSKKIFSGKFFEAWITGETPEICPTEETKGTLVFSLSESICMCQELKDIAFNVETVREAEGLVEKESTLDTLVEEFGGVIGVGEEYRALRMAMDNLQKKLQKKHPHVNWRFTRGN